MSLATGRPNARRQDPMTSHYLMRSQMPVGMRRFAPEIPESTGGSQVSAAILEVLTPLMARPYTRSDAYRGVAQLVARGVWDAEAGGSSPLTPTLPRPLTCSATHMPTCFIGT